MMLNRMIDRAARALVFGRHIPLARLARRIELTARRSVRDHLAGTAKTTHTDVALRRAAAPPAPLFAPRRGRLEVAGSRKAFTFLGRTEAMDAVDWSAPGPGPEHQLWRMNLHYMEYLEEAPPVLWGMLVSDWIAGNPPARPGAWQDSWNSFTVSVRAMVWMQEMARRRKALAPHVVQEAEQSLAEQLLFLERNLETDLGGNHLIKNAAALILASACFGGPDAARWRSIGVSLLERELPRQVLADGMHYERSPSYHAQVFADLLDCRHALGSDPLGGRLDDALLRMAQATADLAHPDGQPALLNDAGLTMARQPAECLDAAMRVLDVRPRPRPMFAFEDAGYFGLRSGDTYLVVDCGRIAPDDLIAHGHGDVLSFEWSVAGKRVVVDQGVYEYAAGERRRLSRAAASHNTLCFDGADQADFFGAFRCGRRPNVAVLRYERGHDRFVLEGTHDGFQHLDGAPRHVRRFEAGPREVVIRDRIEGRPTRPAAVAMLLHPEARADVSGLSARIERDGTTVHMTASLPIVAEPAVWWPDMGCERATVRLRMVMPPGVHDAVTTLRVS